MVFCCRSKNKPVENNENALAAINAMIDRRCREVAAHSINGSGNLSFVPDFIERPMIEEAVRSLLSAMIYMFLHSPLHELPNKFD
jgi:hypothetical protein